MAGEQVLVVEDNEMNMKLFRDVLRASGYRTLEARTGAHAVELARRHIPDVVLMDIQLPTSTASRCCGGSARTSAPRSCRVVAVTAQAMDGDRERFLRAGFDGVHPEAGRRRRAPRRRQATTACYAVDLTSVAAPTDMAPPLSGTD